MKVPLPAGDVKQYPQLVLRSTEIKIHWQIQKGVLFVCLFFLQPYNRQFLPTLFMPHETTNTQ